MSSSNIAEKYNKFQHEFGTGVEQDYDALVEALFTESFTKVINGEVYVSNRAGLIDQLTGLYQAVKGWTVEVISINNTANHDYLSVWRIHTGDGKTYHAEATLASEDGIRINSVTEKAVEVLGETDL